MLGAPRILRPLDIEFSRVPVQCYSSSGVPYTRWKACGVPKLGRYAAILDAIVFLYENTTDARSGANIGGTGFLISLPSKRFPQQVRHTHVVTNWHIAVHGAPSCPVIRLNEHGGGTDIIEFDPVRSSDC
jgi:hypothetical protein